MQNIKIFFFFLAFQLLACTTQQDPALTAFDVYCEMVANDAKPMALQYPMEGADVDNVWDDMKRIAEKHQVQLYREDNFPVSQLFPAAATAGKSVVLIYRGKRLTQYQQWKADVQADTDNNQQEALARRFGRLLGYSPKGINELLSKNSAYRNLASFGVQQQWTHLYYENVAEATVFYEKTLGLNKVDAATFQISEDTFIELHPHNEAHPKGQTKSTAIALLTDQLPAWYAYCQEQNIPIKYTYKPKEGGPHDGFVAIDPGGYLLEFEQFKQHPENELFMAALSITKPIITTIKDLTFYGSITWTYHNDLLLIQQFYEETLGYQLVADQGWTKIYQTSPTGFIGLVDERRGMEDYADTKGVELEWRLADAVGFATYASEYWQDYQYNNFSFMGPEQYIYRLGLME